MRRNRRAVPRPTLTQGLGLLLALGVLSAAPALAQNSDTPGPGKPVPPEVYTLPLVVPPSGVAIFHDRDPGAPWDHGVLAPIKAVLDAHGVAVSVFPSTEMGTRDLTPFTKVITTSVQPVEFWNALEANRLRFEDYVSAGGILELHLASFSSETNTGKVFPGGFVVNHLFNNFNLVKIENPFHRILRQPNHLTAEELQNWDFSAHGFFSTVPPGAIPIIREAETGADNVVAAELALGSGKIVATVQPVEWDLASPRYRENMVLYRPNPAVAVSLTLLGCTICMPGDKVSALVTVSNTGLTPFPVEVKGGVILPDGTPLSVLPNRHIEVGIPPGTTGPIPVLEVVIDPLFPKGDYTAQAALLTPTLGRELSRSQTPLTIK